MSDTEVANSERGELALVLDGQTFVLRPSFTAISAFEAVTGKGLLDLTRAALDGRLPLAEGALIAAECIRAWGRASDNVTARAVSTERIAELLIEMDGGYRAGLAVIGSVLALAATGGCTAQGEVKAAATTTTE